MVGTFLPGANTLSDFWCLVSLCISEEMTITPLNRPKLANLPRQSMSVFSHIHSHLQLGHQEVENNAKKNKENKYKQVMCLGSEEYFPCLGSSARTFVDPDSKKRQPQSLSMHWRAQKQKCNKDLANEAASLASASGLSTNSKRCVAWKCPLL